jgi:hypothetical protein
MNKRIQELAKQAGLEFTYDPTETPMRVFVEAWGEDLEKFAELIVRECVNILEKPEYVMTHPEELTDYNRGWVNGRLLGIEHIKEQFGVEE